MLFLLYAELLLHLLSMVTATIVVLKIFLYDRLGIVTKLCICLIYSSPYVTDISYSYAVFTKITNNQLLFIENQIVTRELTTFRKAVFCHEVGTWLYVWGVILTASERLLNANYNVELTCTSRVVVVAPLLLFIIGFTSYNCTAMLLSHEYQQLAGAIIISSQIFGIAALLYTLYLNRRRYRCGVGESLEQRYRSAYVYKFNRSLLKSLLGEVTCRLLAFSTIIVVTTGRIYENPAFGWLTFTYHNLIPVGSIVFPWFIVLRHMKVELYCRNRNHNVVQDISGNDLVMTESTEAHFRALSKAWDEKWKGAH